MVIKNLFTFSDDFICLFNHKNYEKYVLDIMNSSENVFPGTYEMIEEQSNGECDYLCLENGGKFDAKIPFEKNQISMLTSGKKHKPQTEKWVNSLMEEAQEYNPIRIRDDADFDISQLKLYRIMCDLICKDKKDENIVFFLPYPISLAVRGSIFLQFTTDYLRDIYDKLNDLGIVEKRSIYAIYPSSEKDVFAVRNLAVYGAEYVECKELGKYFSYEIVDILT